MNLKVFRDGLHAFARPILADLGELEVADALTTIGLVRNLYDKLVSSRLRPALFRRQIARCASQLTQFKWHVKAALTPVFDNWLLVMSKYWLVVCLFV